MQLAMIGLGRMGGNMVRRLMGGGHQLVVYDRSPEAVQEHAAKGAKGARDLADVCAQLQAPRVVWVMVPAGAATQATIDDLAGRLAKGDVIIDGGNSNFHDTLRRGEALRAKGIDFVDAGTSGGIWGLEVGYCLMVGGPDEAVERLAPILDVLAPPESEEHGPGWGHFGPTGAGHYVKMVHNGVEYGMMQAYAEGFSLFDSSE